MRPPRLACFLLAILVAGCSPLPQTAPTPNDQAPYQGDYRGELQKEERIAAVHYDPFAGLSGALRHDPAKVVPSLVDMQDPVVQVKDQFLSVVASRLNVTNIRRIDQPRFARNLRLRGARPALIVPLQRTFVKGLVFDFDPIEWELMTYGGLKSLNQDTQLYSLRYVVRGRLIRVDDLRVLWQGTCSLGKGWPHDDSVYEEPPEARKTLAELTENNNALLKIKRDETAGICTKQLSEQFFGQGTIHRSSALE